MNYAYLGRHRASSALDSDTGYQSSFDGVIAHFCHCLEAGEPFETDPSDNLETLRLVEHAYWSAGQRQVVDK